MLWECRYRSFVIEERLMCAYVMWGRARTFMRSVVKEDDSVGMLLFDEPSASLDPIAEHGKRDLSEPSPCGCADVVVYTDLFDRLRQLRGSKTMVFSSHRFGNLTRHADLIL